MVVDADEGAVREGLCEQDRRHTEPAPDVEHPDARLETRDQARHRGEPLGEQRRAVHRPVEPRHAAEDARVVSVPRQPLAGRVRVGELVDRRPDPGDQLEAGGQGGGAHLLREHGGGLDGESEGLAGRVVRDVAVRGLRGQPLLDIAPGHAGALGQRGDGGGALAPVGDGGGQRLPETEPVSQVDQDRVVRRGLVALDLRDELLEPAEVQDGSVELCSHGGFLSGVWRPRDAVVEQVAGARSQRPVTLGPPRDRHVTEIHGTLVACRTCSQRWGPC